jgi:hypothetical protein
MLLPGNIRTLSITERTSANIIRLGTLKEMQPIECPECGSYNLSILECDKLNTRMRIKEFVILFKCKKCLFSFSECWEYRNTKELAAIQIELTKVLKVQLQPYTPGGELKKWHKVGEYDAGGRIVWDYKALEEKIFRRGDWIEML